ncbi:MAG: DUF1467 family protein [Candidatus Paracaedibacteraceae bacterium]|nr:DUF1467 family protein [Candidatus Paracaedibacteraceae bacterium]
MSCIVMFFATWWIVFFMILPIGIKQEDDHIIGCDVGAPKNPNIKKKLLIVTTITIIFLFIYIFYMIFG